ncbi:hypothetical protein DAEQUDRAFT_721869 [Daedalea quercina L-15889]|uniref:Uncharacterized protein n=1 Tax=Daedalea quercina L-15889 TaxID=1314783 RepID=A0A165TDF3_9APHY|nr:hypothetical protein DAEQUDRAFT_721869 [Daedalea quercina L-15889]
MSKTSNSSTVQGPSSYEKWRQAGKAKKLPWHAPLTAPLAWLALASPVQLFFENIPLPPSETGTDEASSSDASVSPGASENVSGRSSDSSPSEPATTLAVPNASASSVNLLAQVGAIRRRPAGSAAMSVAPSSRSSKSINPHRKVVSRIPSRMRHPDGRPLNAIPGVVFAQRYTNPISMPFSVSLRRSDGGQSSTSSSSGETSTSASSDSGPSSGQGSTATLGDPSQDSFGVDTPRVGAQLTSGKIGSLRRLGTKIRKSVSLRSRSASLNIDGRRGARFRPSPLGSPQRVVMRPGVSRSRSRSLSSSLSLPYGLGVEINASELGWEYSLP